MAGFPMTSTSFRWTFNSTSSGKGEGKKKKAKRPRKPVALHRERFKSNRTHSVLKYVARTEKDLGELSCFAANKLGETEKPCVFRLIAAGEIPI